MPRFYTSTPWPGCCSKGINSVRVVKETTMRNARDTQAWIFQVWISFALASVTTVIGICYLPLDIWHRGFLALGFFFSVASSFTLAKTIRDNQDAPSTKSPLGAEPYRS
jgi:hypothetical protein